jgi:hypothetical protein
MTARTIIEAKRFEDLEAFEETFARLEGVADEHHAPGVSLSPERRPARPGGLHRRSSARACEGRGYAAMERSVAKLDREVGVPSRRICQIPGLASPDD